MSTARSYSWQIAAAALCTLSCMACSEDEEPKKGVPTSSASSGTGGTAAGGGSGGIAPGGGGSGGIASGGGGSGGGVGGAGGSPAVMPVCVWPFWETFAGTPEVTTAADDHLGSLSKDELTVAWMTPNGDVHVAERPVKAQPFSGGSFVTLPAAAGYYAFDRVALSPDGLRLVVVSTDRTKLGELTRATTGDTFAGQPDETPFTAINASVGNGESLGDPINVEDERLYYSRYAGASTTTIFYASHGSPGDPWTLAGSLDDAELQQAGGFRMVPTAMAKDRRGLFYWNEATSEAFMASRDLADGAFLTFELLGPFIHANPSDDCSRLYYTDDGVPRDIRYADPP